MKKFFKNYFKESFVIVLVSAFTLGMCIWGSRVQSGYQHYNNESITYVKGMITEISNEELTKDPGNAKRYVGRQKVKAKVLEGTYKGETVEIDNYLTSASNVFVEPGMKVILSQDQPENTAPYFLVYNYYRSPIIYGMVGMFVLLMILIGGKKGIRATLGLAFTLLTIVMLMLPMISSGISPVLASIVTVVITTAVTLLLLNGFSKKTLTAVLGTALGTMIVGVLFGMVSYFLHISGYNTDEAEFMVLISSNTELKVAEVLFAGVLISSLGAVMDVGMSIASAIWEILEVNPALTAKQLFFSGLNVGKDMIGTMSNTLILAFTGSGLSTLLVLTAYGIRYHQFLSSDFLAIEVGQGLSGTMAVILTVPITSPYLLMYIKGKIYFIKRAKT